MTVKDFERRGVTLKPKLTFKSATPLDTEMLMLLQDHKAGLLRELITSDAVPTLPSKLQRLLSAAASDALPKEPTLLRSGFVFDPNRYVLAWGCAYLTGDRDEPLSRLWEVYQAWQGTTA